MTATVAKHRGFTLIELLVTVVVIAIAVGFILPQINWIKTTPPIEKPMRSLATIIELARDEAALQGRNFGIRFYPDSYEILELEPETGAWITIEDDDMLVGAEFGEEFIPRLIIEERDVELEYPDNETTDEPELDAFGQAIAQAGEPPHVVILASGEVSPFELQLDALGDDGFISMQGDFLGSLTLSRERLR